MSYFSIFNRSEVLEGKKGRSTQRGSFDTVIVLDIVLHNSREMDR